MAELPPLGQHTGAVWTRALAEQRMSAASVTDAMARGEWQQLWPGVYTDAGHTPDAVQLAWAAILASGPGAVACGRTAARVWDLPLIDDDDPATKAHDACHHDVAVTRNVGRLVTGSGALHRRQLVLDPRELTRHALGLPLTTPARTLRDLAAVLTPEALVCALDDALRRKLVTPEDLEREVAAAKGSRHVRAFRIAVGRADPGAETPAETLARLLLRPVLPGLRCQVRVEAPWGELIAILDLADEALMFAVEVDGKRGHAGAQMVAKDRRRDRRTGSFGWHTERVTWFELRRQQVLTQRRVLEAARSVITRKAS